MSQWMPIEIQGGASRVGNSYLSLYARCPRKWFYQYLQPTLKHDEAGEEVWHEGISPRFKAETLLRGDIFHEGIAAWYASGSRNGEDSGEYDIDAAIAATEHRYAQTLHQWPDEQLAGRELIETLEMLRMYHDWYGPRGSRRDYPLIKVIHDDLGKPVVEREFLSDVGNGYVYSARIDLAVEHHGYTKVMEHKTSAASWVGRRLQSIRTDAQFTGEIMTLMDAMPSLQFHGCLVNVVVKKRAARSSFDCASRETTNRTPLQVNQFRDECRDILERIDDAVDGFKRTIDRGHSPHEAASVWFPRHGTRTDACYSYNRECEFMDLCMQPGFESENLGSFRPRSRGETKADREFTG